MCKIKSTEYRTYLFSCDVQWLCWMVSQDKMLRISTQRNILTTYFICEIISSMSKITRWSIGRIFDIILIIYMYKNVLFRSKQVQWHSNDYIISWNRIHVLCKKSKPKCYNIFQYVAV